MRSADSLFLLAVTCLITWKLSFSSQLTEKYTGVQDGNGFSDAFSDAIDRLQISLEDARAMPSWSVVVLVIVALAAWERRASGEKPFEQEREDEDVELTPSVDESEVN